MTHNFSIEAIVADFAPTIAHKDHPGVYEMKGGFKKAGAQKVEFIQLLFRQFPIRLIWLKDVNKDPARTLGKPLSTRGEASLWMLPDTISLPQLFDGLYEGGWAMFFLPNTPQQVPTPPEFIPTKPEEVRKLLSTLGASIGILSWYDDIEWLIVSSVEHN